MDSYPRVLICDDDDLFHMTAKAGLPNEWSFHSVHNTTEALAALESQDFDVLLLDIQMRTPDEGLRNLPRLRETDERLAIVMSSSMTDYKTVREAMKNGANDYIAKDDEAETIEHVIQRAIAHQNLKFRNQQKNSELLKSHKSKTLMGKSAHIQEIKKVLGKLSRSDVNIVIQGPTGTGKEIVARQLRSLQSDGTLEPFVAVDSSTIQSSMAESMLFGHEKGAFTGADKSAPGVFEQANGGIVYFDEISNMPLDIQAKLLRVIQEKEVRRLGSSKVHRLDFRVVCATNRDLQKMVDDGEFMGDLYQRLNVIPLKLEPLSKRPEDIPELLDYFCELLSPRYQRLLRFEQETVDYLAKHSWPGNVRELQNLVAYLYTMNDEDEVLVSDLPPLLRDQIENGLRGRPLNAESDGSEISVCPAPNMTFYEKVAQFEKAVLEKDYGEMGSNLSKMAISLGMDRSHLYSKLRQHGIYKRKKKELGSSSRKTLSPGARN